MKKLVCTLLVSMITMAPMAFAQVTVDEPEYLKVTNKTTKETQIIMFDSFSLRWGAYYGVLPAFPLGIYAEDVIEISYGGGYPKIKPRLVWSYGVGSIEEDDFFTGLTAQITIPKLSLDNQVFWIGFTYQIVFTYPPTGTPTPFMINAENKVRNETRFNYSYNSVSKVFRVTYNHYDEVHPYLTKNPYVTATNANTGLTVFSGYMNDNGEISFNTGSTTGIVIVNVVADGVTMPAQKIYVK